MPRESGYVPGGEVAKGGERKKMPKSLMLAILAALSACGSREIGSVFKDSERQTIKFSNELEDREPKKKFYPEKDSSGLTAEQLSTLENPEHRIQLYKRIKRLSHEFGVPVKEILGILGVESKGQHRSISNPEKVTSSNKDAVGYMGLKKSAVAELNYGIAVENEKRKRAGRPFLPEYTDADRYDSVKNLEMGVAFIRKIYDKYAGRNWDFTNLIYNQGYGSVLRSLNNKYHPSAPKGMNYYIRLYKRGGLRLDNSYPGQVCQNAKRMARVFAIGKYREPVLRQSGTGKPQVGRVGANRNFELPPRAYAAGRRK